MESPPKLEEEHVSQKIESIRSSARDAEKEITEMLKNRIKEFLQKEFEKNNHIKTFGEIFNSVLSIAGSASQVFYPNNLEKVSSAIASEQKITRDNLVWKFNRAISNLDSMSTSNRLTDIMKILKKYELEHILDYINTEPIQATVLPRKQNSEIFSK